MNYTIENGTYIANDGYCFVNKNNGALGIVMHLATGDSIDNYDCIEKPVEPENSEEPLIEPVEEDIDYETAYNELMGVIDNVI